jgi:hypothetical protein
LPDDARFRILLPLQGRVTIQHGDSRHAIGLGDTVLIPACLEGVTVGSAASQDSRTDASTLLEVFVR